MPEPTVLDYVKALLTPWKGPAPAIPSMTPPLPENTDQPEKTPAAEPAAAGAPPGGNGLGKTPAAEMPPAAPQITTVQPALEEKPAEAAASRATPVGWPWRTLGALFLALIAQITLEPGPERSWVPGAVLYTLAAVWLVWGLLKAEGGRMKDELEENSSSFGAVTSALHLSSLSFTYRPVAFVVSLILGLAAFWFFGGGEFNELNVILWVAATGTLVYAMWEGEAPWKGWMRRAKDLVKQRQIRISITPWALLMIGAALLVIFFRVYQLNQVPPEMVSDHAEKLLDVQDVLNGKLSIFFPRNTGREAFQFYLIAATVLLFHTGITFLSMKIGTVTAGLLTLPFIYLTGKEISSRRVGLIAAVFAGIAYWPNVVSRIALRFTLYPFFLAPALYFLVRALRRSSRNDFILAGLFVGLGLHGYTPFRIVPLVVLIALGMYLVHRQMQGARRVAVEGFLVLVIVSIFIFMPLGRYALENPEMFAYRALTRVGDVERPLPLDIIGTFLRNTWRAITMFAWDDGEIWVVSVTHRPVLDFVSGALFHLGVVLLLVRYIRRRNWLDLFLLLAVPLLELPSILSLAFPNENPATNRAAGAMVPVFLIVGLALDWIIQTLQERLRAPAANWAAASLVGMLLLFSASQNYDLVFNQYETTFRLSSWNTSEMGQVIHDFAQSSGSLKTAWVVAFPYWVDTRLVGMTAGRPDWDYAIQPGDLANTLQVPDAKLFLVNLDDSKSLAALRSMYPQAWIKEYMSSVDPSKDFMMVYVPPSK